MAYYYRRVGAWGDEKNAHVGCGVMEGRENLDERYVYSIRGLKCAFGPETLLPPCSYVVYNVTH